MNTPKEFYTNQKELFSIDLQKVKQQLLVLGILRLLVFLATAYGIYSFFGNTKPVLLTAVFGIAVFLFLVSKYTDLQLKKQKKEALIALNNLELDVLNGDFTNLKTGKEFVNSAHEFSYDIDLFGPNSFFQRLNRTATTAGKKELANDLSANSINNILKKQQAHQELANKPKWRQNFSATASLVDVATNQEEILDFIKNHQRFLPKYLKYVPTLFFGISIALFVTNYLGYLPFKITLIWFGIGLLVTGKYVKKINTFYSKVSDAKEIFKQYFQLLQLIEQETFTSQLLKEKQEAIAHHSEKASVIFKKFSTYLDALDQRNNILFAVLGNGFALWDIQQVYRIENWVDTYKNNVEKWFEVITFFDAHNSYGNYIFNHTEYVFPKIIKQNTTIKTVSLGHPLLKKEKRVDNDFMIEDNQFFIITGANMAGKSTFLRTVSLSIVMSNVGLPVCAKKFDYQPIKLITSMRTDDSLSEDTSYFFSELKRLKFIVEAIKKERYFIILDEILKGTNSKDKAIGSKKFVEKLVKSKATGIIATHDLSLCEIASELPQVKNHFFDAQIINDELYFDYSFKEGICKNMNASFLLKKMAIV
ncbi:MAG TPA: DNA mismatch repair protein MutS [Flavobacteriia bacterium]|nr:DNA mismatch repair protein MutS [Flavobacteriia bacterium]